MQGCYRDCGVTGIGVIVMGLLKEQWTIDCYLLRQEQKQVVLKIED